MSDQCPSCGCHQLQNCNCTPQEIFEAEHPHLVPRKEPKVVQADSTVVMKTSEISRLLRIEQAAKDALAESAVRIVFFDAEERPKVTAGMRRLYNAVFGATP